MHEAHHVIQILAAVRRQPRLHQPVGYLCNSETMRDVERYHSFKEEVQHPEPEGRVFGFIDEGYQGHFKLEFRI